MLFETNSNCPVCKTKSVLWCTAMDWEYRSTTKTYTYLKCTFCNTIFIKEVDETNLSVIYPVNYYSFLKKSPGLLFKFKNIWETKFYKPILKKIKSPVISVLDIGGGVGDVLDVLKKADKRISYTEIVDIDKEAKNTATKKGHIYTLSTIEKYETNKKFDVILLLNIIEHVADPFFIINKASEMLSEEGIIIIKTPNADSLDARIFKNHYWGGLHCPRHWIIFSDISFKKMLAPSNLVLNKISFTQGAPFWAYSILQLFSKKDINKKKKPIIHHPLFGIISILFAAFDICRSSFSKTSQMFIILSK